MTKFIKPSIHIIDDRQFIFGTFDIETYPIQDGGRFIPYCAAAFYDGLEFTAYTNDYYKTYVGRKTTVITDVIMILIYRLREYMIAINRKSVILYAHNLSSFDGYLILRTCATHGIKVEGLKRDTEIFFIRFKLDGVEFDLRCSLLLLRQGLNGCAKSFGVEMVKLPFDHDSVTPSTLFSVGVTSFSGGDSIDFRSYAIKYCVNDCIMLYQILLVFNSRIREFGLSLASNVYSIPGLAFRAFKQNYLPPALVPNLTMKKSYDTFIRGAYYGGRTEVFRSFTGGNKGYYYDVKGMYAQAMKKPLPCGKPEWRTKFDRGWLIEDMPKGYYKVSVEAPPMDIPVLPYRSPEGKLLFPCGRWEGTYYSDELLLAKDKGYLLTPIEALIFKECQPFLREYVEYFTKMKDMGGAYRAIGKLFINSLYGRFGFRGTGQITIMIPSGGVDYYSQRFDIVDSVEIGNYTLLTYIGKPVVDYYKDSGIFSEYGRDYRAFQRSYRYSESNVGVAAAITALGRIHLYNNICSVVEHGGKVAYCDTDSIYAEFETSPLGE